MIKCILPLILFMFIGLISQAQVVNETVAKTTKTSETACEKVCAPAACKALVKLGICTPEQAAKCQKNVKTASVKNNIPFATEVAAVSQTRTEEEASQTKSSNCKAVCLSKKVQACKAKTKEE